MATGSPAKKSTSRSVSPIKSNTKKSTKPSIPPTDSAAATTATASNDTTNNVKIIKPASSRPASPNKRKNIIDQHSTITKKVTKTASANSLSKLAKDDVFDGDVIEEVPDDIPVRKAGFGKQITNTWSTSTLPDVGTTASIMEEVMDDPGMMDEEDEIDKSMSREENVVVCLRVRPLKAGTSAGFYHFLGAEDRITLDATHPTFAKRGAMSKTTAHDIQTGEYDFRFDALHLSPSLTETLYERKIRPVVRAAMQGFNGTVFAYGQTASGKTHTMMGNPDEIGIIPLAIQELFSFILKQDTLRTFSMRVSFLEIYNEVFSDLLASTARPLTSKPLEVHGDDGMVNGLVERPVNNPDEVMHLLAEGEKRRRVGMTDWNDRSSRSHCVFIVTIESIDMSTGGAARTSRLNLIDLAGSESATSSADRQKEGSFINKSLLTLGSVIAKLTEPRSAHSHVPFRNSKLTRLLQPALSGKSRVAIICTISPDAEQATETLSTLKFAKRAKMVVTKAERNNLVTDQMMLKMYATEVENLKSLIAAGESAVADGEMARERDTARAQVGELTSQKDRAEAELARKELELNQLKEQLEHTNSFLLTGPVLEANTRRTSGQFGISVGLNGVRDLLMNGTPSRGGFSAKRNASDLTGLGLGTPRNGKRTTSAIVIGSPRVGSAERELALEVELEEARKALLSLEEKDDESSTLREHVDRLKKSTSLARVDLESFTAGEEERKSQVRLLQLEIEGLKVQLSDSEELNTVEREFRKKNGLQDKDEMNSLVEKLSKVELDSKGRVDELKVANEKILDLEEVGQAACKKIEEGIEKLKVEKGKRKKLEITLADSTKGGTEAVENLRISHSEEIESISASHQIQMDNWEIERLAMSAERDALDGLAKDAIERLEATEIIVSANITELESLRAQLTLSTTTISTQQTSITTLETRIATLEAELVTKQESFDKLYTSLASYKKADEIRSTYAAQQKLGTNGLKNKIAELTARSSLNSGSNNGAISPPLESSRSLRSSKRSSEGEDVLQLKNVELAATVGKLERRLKDSDADRLNQLIVEQDRKLEESRRKEEEWKSMYLESQRLITSSSRPQLAELNLLTRSHPTLPPLAEKSIPSLPAPSSLTTSISSTRTKHISGTPTKPNLPSSPSLNLSGLPAPLPYSPHNQEAARKLRRVTLDKELGALKASHSVGRKQGNYE